MGEREIEGERLLNTLHTRRPEEYLHVPSLSPENSSEKSNGVEGYQPTKEASYKRFEEYKSEDRSTFLIMNAFITADTWEGGISWATHIEDVPVEEGRI